MRRVWVVAIIALLLFTFVPSTEGASTPNVQKIVSVKLGKGTTGKVGATRAQTAELLFRAIVKYPAS